MKSPAESTSRGPASLLQRQPWLVFVLPFAVYMVVGSFEPTPETPGGQSIGLSIPYVYYPAVYGAKIGLTLLAMLAVLPGYRAFPLRVRPLSLVVGVVGVVVWVGLCRLDLEHRFLQPMLEGIGLDWLIGSGTRSAFNPFEQYPGQPAWAWGFLALRLLGLAAVVPVIEELFLRGFVMRFVTDPNWPELPIGQVSRAAIVVGTLLPMLMHPGELLAAAVWFSMVTWLMLKTRSLWDCVAAHMTTNLLLGLYVLLSGDWRLM